MNFAQRRSALHDNAPALFVRGYPVRSRRTIARPRSRSSARPIAGPSSMPVCGRVPPPVPVPPVPVPPLVAVAVPWKMLVPKILGVGVWSICAIASVAVGCGVFVAVDVAVFVGCGVEVAVAVGRAASVSIAATVSVTRAFSASVVAFAMAMAVLVAPSSSACCSRRIERAAGTKQRQHEDSQESGNENGKGRCLA